MIASVLVKIEMRDVMVRGSLAVMLWLTGISAEAASKADQTGVLRAAGVVAVARRAELLETSYHKDLLSRGVDEASITDGTLVYARLLCCQNDAKYSSPMILYNSLAIKVAPGDFIEVRMGDTKPRADTMDGFITITRVMQYADQNEGKCWWKPRIDGLWMRYLISREVLLRRYVFCEWMPAEGWVWQGGSWNPAWYKPPEIVESQ